MYTQKSLAATYIYAISALCGVFQFSCKKLRPLTEVNRKEITLVVVSLKCEQKQNGHLLKVSHPAIVGEKN